MKKTAILFFLMCCLLYPAATFAQNYNWASGGTGGSEGWAEADDPWGNTFEAGFNNPELGTLLFGPYTLTGYGEHATILVKYNPYGQILWATNTNIGVSRPLGIAADPWGNAYLLAWYSDTLISDGSFNLYNPGATIGSVELFMAKYSATGTVLWAKNLCTIVTGVLPYWSEEGNIATNGTNVFITGSFTVPVLSIGSFSFTNADPTDSTLDLFIAKLDTSGNVIWARHAAGTGDDISNSIAITPSGDSYITGTFTSTTLSFGTDFLSYAYASNLFLAKYDSDGNVLWAQSPSGYTIDGSVATDSAENVYLTGSYYNSVLSLGGSVSLPPDTVFDVFIAKYNPSGNAEWAKRGYANENSAGYGIEPDPCGNIWVTGGIEKDSVFILDGNIFTRPPQSRDPMFLAGWDPTGNYLTGNILPTGGDDVSNISIDGVGNIYVGGDYWGGPYTIGGNTLNDPNHAYENISISQYQTAYVQDTDRVHTLVCIIDSPVELKAPAGYRYYRWSDGLYTQNRTVSDTGVYTLYATGKCGSGVLMDIFTVDTGRLDTSAASQDTTSCIHAMAVLTAPGGYTVYYWSNGGIAQTDTISASGDYIAVCEGTCTIPTLYDTFHVTQNTINLSFSLGDDTSVCAPYGLEVNLPGATYLWEDGSTANTDTATQTGIYFVTASEQNCLNTDSVFVDFLNLTQNLQDTDFCKNQPIEITLHGNVPARATALWSTGNTTDSITVDYPGRYWVTVTDAACMGTDTMTLGTVDCNCNAVLPEAFTPNNDGINDWYFPIFEPTCNLFDYTFCIYNRWGQLVYSTHEQTGKWDGKYFGTPQDIGVYMYYVEYKVQGSYKPYIFKGDLTLVK